MIDPPMSNPRFPSPWIVTRDGAAFCVIDGHGVVLSRTHFGPVPGMATISEAEALVLAQGFAAVPDLLRELHAANLSRTDSGAIPPAKA